MQKQSLLIMMAVLLIIFGNTSCMNSSEGNSTMESNTQEGEYSIATFAGGCFWCMEPPFEALDRVKEVITGYTGGDKKDQPMKRFRREKPVITKLSRLHTTQI